MPELYKDFHRDAGVTAEDVDHLDAGGIPAACRIFVIPEIADRFQAAVLSCAIILPVVLKGLALLPIKVHGPKVDEIKAALYGPFLQSLQLLARCLGEVDERFSMWQSDKVIILRAQRSSPILIKSTLLPEN